MLDRYKTPNPKLAPSLLDFRKWVGILMVFNEETKTRDSLVE